MRWLANRTFNHFDGMCMYAYGALLATGHYWWFVILLVVGPVLSALIEHSALSNSNAE